MIENRSVNERTVDAFRVRIVTEVVEVHFNNFQSTCFTF